jgi:RNA polymerase sigma-70 factor (ECF subfamily)
MGGDWKEAASRAMDRYADGDDGAFKEVVDLLLPHLLRFFLRRVRDRGHAEDLVQETFSRMHAARAQFAPGGEVMPWAYVISHRLFIDFYRQRRKERCRDAELKTRTELEDGAGPSSEHLLGCKQLGERLERALEKLHDSYRQAFELVEIDELSIREAAAVACCTETAMKLRAFRSREALRAVLGDDFGGRT